MMSSKETIFLLLLISVFCHFFHTRSSEAPHHGTGVMHFLRVFIIALLCVNVKCHQKTEIVVGFLPAIKGDLKERQGLSISGAMTMALDEINKSPNILPNVELVLQYNDTRGDIVTSTRAITEMICSGVSAIFGPEGASCYVEAIVTQSRNIPMLAYVSALSAVLMRHFQKKKNHSRSFQKCSDYKASDIPTFARTEPPDTQVCN